MSKNPDPPPHKHVASCYKPIITCATTPHTHQGRACYRRDDTLKCNLEITLPDVVEEPKAVIVRCGETTIEVYEYGRAGSGDWVGWTSGHTVTEHCKTLLEAVQLARHLAAKRERNRLAHQALRAAL